MSEENVSSLDLEIIVDTLHSVSDLDSLDAVIHSWERKLSSIGYDDLSLKSEGMLRQNYSRITGLLRRIGFPKSDDPINHAVHAVLEPAVVITDRQRVLAVNDAGERAFDTKQGKILELGWIDDRSKSAFADAVSQLRSKANRSVWLLRTRNPAGFRGFAEVYVLQDVALSGPALAIRELSIDWSDEIRSALLASFDLTEAEVEVAQLMYQYAEISLIAEARGVNVKTIRKQLSQIFLKTETSGQVDLVRLLSMLSARLASKREAKNLEWSDPYGRERLIHVPGRGAMAYTWLGDEHGKPALFVPGLVNGYQFPDAFQRTLQSNGVKLFVLSRPGTGNCVWSADGGPLEQHVSLILNFCESLNLAGRVGVGLHATVSALIAAAARNRGAFSTIIGIGRFLPLDLNRMKRVAPVPRALVWMANNAPWAADVIGQQAMRAIHKHGPDWYINRAYGDMPFDFASTRQVELAPLIRNACSYSLKQGYQIFFHDFIMRKINTGLLLKECSAHLHWLLGSINVYDGKSTPTGFYEEAEIQNFVASHPSARFECVADAGDLICYQRPELVAQRISEAVHGNLAGN